MIIREKNLYGKSIAVAYNEYRTFTVGNQVKTRRKIQDGRTQGEDKADRERRQGGEISLKCAIKRNAEFRIHENGLKKFGIHQPIFKRKNH